MNILRYSLIALIMSLFTPADFCFADENPFYVKFNGRYSPSVDVKDQDGEIEYSKISLRLGFHKTLDNGLPFYVNIGPDHYIFKESDINILPPDAKSRGLRLGTEFHLPFVEDDRYSLGIELNPTFQSAKEVGFDGDAFRFNFSTFIKFRTENDFVWVLGANIRPQYDMVALPIVGFNYRVNDKLSFNLVSDAPNISYEVTEKTKLLWEFDYTFDEFEQVGGGRDGSILQVQDFATGLGIEHKFNDHISSSVGMGGDFDRIIKYQDENGKVVPENGVYFKVKVNASF